MHIYTDDGINLLQRPRFGAYLCSSDNTLHDILYRDAYLYPSHNNSSVHLTIIYVRSTGRIANGMRSGWSTVWDFALSPTPAPTLPAWASQEQRESDSAPVSDVSAPACTNGVRPPLRPVSVAQKNKPSTKLSSNAQSIDPHGAHDLTVLDDETIEWLRNICPEI